MCTLQTEGCLKKRDDLIKVTTALVEDEKCRKFLCVNDNIETTDLGLKSGLMIGLVCQS